MNLTLEKLTERYGESYINSHGLEKIHRLQETANVSHLDINHLQEEIWFAEKQGRSNAAASIYKREGFNQTNFFELLEHKEFDVKNMEVIEETEDKIVILIKNII